MYNKSVKKNSANGTSLKKILALLLVILTVAGCFYGCKKKTGVDVCVSFIEYIRTGKYGEAYELLSGSSRNDTAKISADTITKQEFIDKYNAIISDLEIITTSYTGYDELAGEAICTYSYNLTYYSEVVGEITNNYRMTAMLEEGEWRIKWTPSLIFPEMQWGDTVRMSAIPAKRGEILAKGDLLACNRGFISVYATPSKIEDKTLFASQVGALLELTADEVSKKLSKEYGDVAVLKQYYQGGLLDSVKLQLLAITGVGVDNGNFSSYRDYPYGSMLAHIIGYTGKASQEEVNAFNEGREKEDGLYTTDSSVGKLGLELAYERELRGRDGKQVYISTKENTVRSTLLLKPAQNGSDIHLTIDVELQLRTEELLRLVLYGDNTAGSVIVQDPETGYIQAMASYPTFNLNSFSRGISEEEYSALLNMPNKPLFNRLTRGTYPPGSIFKPFTAAMALEDGKLSPSDVFSGEITEDRWMPPASQYPGWDGQPIKRATMKYRTEPLNMRNAVLNSDNIYFADAALKVGAEAFSEHCRRYGLLEAVPFDLPVTSAQLINKDSDLTPKLLADSGYGQGEILITPLQATTMFTSFCTGGTILAPVLIEGIYQNQGTDYVAAYKAETKIFKENAIRQGTVDTLLPMMEDVVDSRYNGTGQNLKVNSCKIAGKTGTAQVGNDRSREIAWFMGFRAEDTVPPRLVVVMLEVPAEKEYSGLKFDIARQLLKVE